MGRTNGCTESVRGDVHLTMFFPKGKQCCKNCNMMRREDGIRFRCMATQYLIYDPEAIQYGCPIEWEEEHG